MKNYVIVNGKTKTVKVFYNNELKGIQPLSSVEFTISSHTDVEISPAILHFEDGVDSFKIELDDSLQLRDGEELKVKWLEIKVTKYKIKDFDDIYFLTEYEGVALTANPAFKDFKFERLNEITCRNILSEVGLELNSKGSISFQFNEERKSYWEKQLKQLNDEWKYDIRALMQESPYNLMEV